MSHIKTLLISHFYNEEFLLPHWIKQHINMFDDVVMIDYDSTDNSVDIIKSMAPHWQIRTSRNREFHYAHVDEEVMDIEKEFDGYWKIALNTTEFAFMRELNMKKLIESTLAVNPTVNGLRAIGVDMIDCQENVDKPVDLNSYLFMQRHHGYTDKNGSRCRLLHRQSCGSYGLGRHNYGVQPSIFVDNEFYCLWYGWSPYCDSLRKRKMQIQTRIPAGHIEGGLGTEHGIPNVEVLNQRFTSFSNSNKTQDLFQDAAFYSVAQSCI